MTNDILELGMDQLDLVVGGGEYNGLSGLIHVTQMQASNANVAAAQQGQPTVVRHPFSSFF